MRFNDGLLMNAAAKPRTMDVDLAAILGLEDTFFLPRQPARPKSRYKLPLLASVSVAACLGITGLIVHLVPLPPTRPNPIATPARQYPAHREVSSTASPSTPQPGEYVAEALARSTPVAPRRIPARAEFRDDFAVNRIGHWASEAAQTRPDPVTPMRAGHPGSRQRARMLETMPKPDAPPATSRFAQAAPADAVIVRAAQQPLDSPPHAPDPKLARDERASERREAIDAIRALRR